MSTIAIKRAYESASPGDGFRILVDRFWPRGVKQEHARIDLWLKDVAPSTALRKWFGHVPANWQAFGERYRDEVAGMLRSMSCFRLRVSTSASPSCSPQGMRNTTMRSCCKRSARRG